jgi:hypothetical protein
MNHSPDFTKFAGLVILALLALFVSAAFWSEPAPSLDQLSASVAPPRSTLTPLPDTTAGNVHTGVLPERFTATPGSATARVFPTAPRTPSVTSPFRFPTSPPTISPTPSVACNDVFPLASVESITFGVTTITQLEASFGRARYQSGRAPRFRFEEGDCVMIVTVGVDEVLDAELLRYGTLNLLLESYGEPERVGVSQGNLTLLDIGHAVLLYPDMGIIAIFEVGIDTLAPDTPVYKLQFRPPYAAEKQAQRLNLRLIEDWTLPESPPLPR